MVFIRKGKEQFVFDDGAGQKGRDIVDFFRFVDSRVANFVTIIVCWPELTVNNGFKLIGARARQNVDVTRCKVTILNVKRRDFHAHLIDHEDWEGLAVDWVAIVIQSKCVVIGDPVQRQSVGSVVSASTLNFASSRSRDIYAWVGSQGVLNVAANGWDTVQIFQRECCLRPNGT
ncbi:MAG: Uncharacterised protein [Rhodobiaceae bacterium UBA7378]|nr:MAG: Uncharacterised protein [Rhodobiaceae bacterium UBA7378]